MLATWLFLIKAATRSSVLMTKLSWHYGRNWVRSAYLLVVIVQYNKMCSDIDKKMVENE